MSYNLIALKQQIVEVGKRMYNRGYVASNDGNISAKVDDERVVISPTGVSKGFMTVDMMVVVDMNGKVLNGNKKASSEVFMHLQVYKDRPDVRSVCHSHPPYATGYAVAGIPLDKCVLPEVVIALGNIPIVEYGTPGTDEFYKPVVPLLKDYDAFLLANHGALTVGKDVLNAYHKMETLEHFAHIAFVAQHVGQINVLNKDQVKKLTDQREKYGIRTTAGCITCETEGTCDIPSHSHSNDNFNFQNLSKSDKDKLIEEITESILRKLR
ncbi:MAG: class II aldolase/adducin family protein [Ignavibacteriales bacterium]|nr:class II aldolase/adducin family protein [Ignavibacteriales bacterium]MCB9218131.1 class II aldolase/adducin family protein [Ignavibacteriales bacterium]MCB9260520.1 class II aldolase/adducin family protein [Ignavibacteriales bacterium]